MMKSKVILTALLAVLALPVAAQVTVKYDEFDHTTTVSMEPNVVKRADGLMSIISIQADRETMNEILLALSFRNDDWKYRDCYGVKALADGQPVDVGKSDHKGQVKSDGTVIETMLLKIDLDTMKTLAKAKVTKLKVCNTVVLVTPKEQSEMAEFVAKLTEK